MVAINPTVIILIVNDWNTSFKRQIVRCIKSNTKIYVVHRKLSLNIKIQVKVKRWRKIQSASTNKKNPEIAIIYF
jgi:hypothetical protein